MIILLIIFYSLNSLFAAVSSGEITFTASPSVPANSDPVKTTELQVTSFQDISKLLAATYKEFPDNFKKTIIFIDLDDTFLNNAGRKDGSQTLYNAEALDCLFRWKNSGCTVAFLTSRSESERGITKQNLAKVGVKPEWGIPLLITDGNKKGDWLTDEQSFVMLPTDKKDKKDEYKKVFVKEWLSDKTTIVHIDDKKHQLDSVKNVFGPKKNLYLFHFGVTTFGDENTPEDISSYSQEQTTSGSNKATFILNDKATGMPKFVVKKGTDRVEQFKEEVLADALYQAIGMAEPKFGINVSKFRVAVNPEKNQYERVAEYLPGEAFGLKRSDAENKKVAAGFVVDAFMANWDLTANDNLWLSNDKIYRLDNGGSLRYRAQGVLKSTVGYDFISAISDLSTLRDSSKNSAASTVYSSVTEDEILQQIEQLIPLKNIILKTADEYNERLHIKDYSTLKSNLITRLDSLRQYYYDHPKGLKEYRLSHPFRMVVPGKSSASVLIYAQDPKDRKLKVLLGKRVGHSWWGNFGGKADDTDQTLLNAAIREVTEESMGEYVFLKEDLLKAPSHDLLKASNGPDCLHRMYLVQSHYQDPEILKAKLVQQTDGHSKEYTAFEWVGIDELLKLVNINLNTLNVNDENQYKLTSGVEALAVHHPLMDMLRQEPVLNWLRLLANNDLDLAKNKLRLVNTEGSFGLPAQRNLITKKVRKIQTDGTYLEGEEIDNSYPLPPFWDPRSDRLAQMQQIMTSRMDLLTEVKNKQQVTTPMLKLSDTTATDSHLKWSLEKVGAHYQENNDQANVYAFMSKASNLAKNKGYAEEFAPQNTVCENDDASYRCAILGAMRHERKMKDWFVLYHSLPGQLAFLYDVLTEFRNVLRLQGSNSIHSLRAFDKFFKGLQNVEEFVEASIAEQKESSFKYIDNYKGHFQERGLSTNISLFGNPNTLGSSTFNYFHENYTSTPPNFTNLLNLLLTYFGISNTQKYLDLFNSYFTQSLQDKALGATKQPNHLLQIFVNPSVVNQVVYLSESSGKGLYETFAAQKEKFLPSKFLEKLRENCQDAGKELESARTNLDTIQARLFMKPEIMSDANKVIIKRYSQQPINSGYDKALREMVKEDLQKWLQSNYELTADTLENPSSDSSQSLPPLQKVYRHSQQAQSIEYKTKTPEELYGKFLVDGNLEGIKQILARNPNFNLFQKIHNPNYLPDDVETINPISIMIGKANIWNFIFQKYTDSEHINEEYNHLFDNAFVDWFKFLPYRRVFPDVENRDKFLKDFVAQKKLPLPLIQLFKDNFPTNNNGQGNPQDIIYWTIHYISTIFNCDKGGNVSSLLARELCTQLINYISNSYKDCKNCPEFDSFAKILSKSSDDFVKTQLTNLMKELLEKFNSNIKEGLSVESSKMIDVFNIAIDYDDAEIRKNALSVSSEVLKLIEDQIKSFPTSGSIPDYKTLIILGKNSNPDIVNQANKLLDDFISLKTINFVFCQTLLHYLGEYQHSKLVDAFITRYETSNRAEALMLVNQVNAILNNNQANKFSLDSYGLILSSLYDMDAKSDLEIFSGNAIAAVQTAVKSTDHSVISSAFDFYRTLLRCEIQSVKDQAAVIVPDVMAAIQTIVKNTNISSVRSTFDLYRILLACEIQSVKDQAVAIAPAVIKYAIAAEQSNLGFIKKQATGLLANLEQNPDTKQMLEKIKSKAQQSCNCIIQ